MTSKTSPKITSTVEQTLAGLREGDRRRDSLVSAYFQRCADLAAAEDRVDRVRQSGQAQIAKVTAAVEQKVEAAGETAGRPERRSPRRWSRWPTTWATPQPPTVLGCRFIRSAPLANENARLLSWRRLLAHRRSCPSRSGTRMLAATLLSARRRAGRQRGLGDDGVMAWVWVLSAGLVGLLSGRGPIR